MPRTPLFQRVPKIWQRLDDDHVLEDFLGVVDSEFDRIHDKIDSLFDLRNVDRIPDRYLPLLASLVGCKWHDDHTYAWNRRRIRDAIHRHSYKGTITRLEDILCDAGFATRRD